MPEARIDKWMWAVRIFKTRTIAAEACKKGRISINGSYVKAARMISYRFIYFLLNWFMVILIPARQKLFIISPAVSRRSSIVFQSSSVKWPST